MMQPLFSSAIRNPYGTESFDTHSFNCLLSGHGLSSRTNDNGVMDSIQESHCASEVPEAADGENLFPITEGRSCLSQLYLNEMILFEGDKVFLGYFAEAILKR
ncbi:hypothetical protein GH714_038524 [Hevea brasiliensis]|uniref:Uncharacterized protein n=1 Tax=Hevea brasiliensis TaxID=3981 RepID=A0A6A6KTQ4_HEVBR|nr:hypothetical protein GH714_038524 [Hevea brasiliensis]